MINNKAGKTNDMDVPQKPFDADRIIDGVRRNWRQSSESPYPSMVKGTFSCNLLEFRDVAAVIAGVKPMAMVSLSKFELLPGEEHAYELARFMIASAREHGFCVKTFESPYHWWKVLGGEEWFVGSPEAVERASEAWLRLHKVDYRSETARDQHRIIGECLGIPGADVERWICSLS